MIIGPAIEVNPIEGDTPRADRNRSKTRAYVAMKAGPVHGEITRRIAQPDQARRSIGFAAMGSIGEVGFIDARLLTACLGIRHCWKFAVCAAGAAQASQHIECRGQREGSCAGIATSLLFL